MNELVSHPFKPVYNNDSRLLILGSFPSVKSREGEFYYHHPRNRFWKVISHLYNSEEPITIEEKRNILLKNNIAIWDVIRSCEVTGSADSSIKNIETKVPIIKMPSTSPANAQYNFEKLISKWKDIDMNA